MNNEMLGKLQHIKNGLIQSREIVGTVGVHNVFANETLSFVKGMMTDVLAQLTDVIDELKKNVHS